MNLFVSFKTKVPLVLTTVVALHLARVCHASDLLEDQHGTAINPSGGINSLFEGDLLVPKSFIMDTYGEEVAESMQSDGFIFVEEGSGSDRRDLAATTRSRWPNRVDGVATIAYQFQAGLDGTRKDAARAAHAILERSGVVKFVERTSETIWFDIGNFDPDNCYAYIGFVARHRDGDGNGAVNLGTCNSRHQLGFVVHEHLHMLGFYHEHARPDRDEFIALNAPPDPTVEGAVSNWQKQTYVTVDSLESPYDFASVMHYQTYAFGVSYGLAPGASLPSCIANVGSIGQRVGPSAIDIDQLRRLYMCASGSRSGSVECSADCPCWEGAYYDCTSDDECQGDLICGTPIDTGPEGWFCDSQVVLPTSMCIMAPPSTTVDPPSTTMIPSNTTVAPPCEGGSCGDPHFKKWNGSYFDFHGECDLVLLSDPNFALGLGLYIYIRTKIHLDYSFIESAAIRIGDDTLEVSSWGQYILNGVYSATMPAMLGPYVVEYALPTKNQATNHYFKVQMENDLVIQINTLKDWVNVKVIGANEENFGNATGMMGEFRTGTMLARNGMTVLEDPEQFGNEWKVLDSEPKIFQNDHSASQCTMPTTKASVRRRLGGSVAQEAAEGACAVHFDTDSDLIGMCIFDVLASGDLEMANAGVF